MDYAPIKKNDIDQLSVEPNLLNLKETREAFKWEDIDRELDGLEGGGLNIAYEVLDRHVETSNKDKIALYW